MSGLLRALCAPPAVRCLRLLPPPLTPDDEPAFLEAAQQLLREVVVVPPAQAPARPHPLTSTLAPLPSPHLP